MRRPCLLLLLALTACDGEVLTDAGPPVVDAGPVPDAGGPPEDLDGFLEWHMAVGGIPGMAVAVVRPDGVAFVGTYGLADIESDRVVDEHTLFTMASVSKTFAAVRAMQLSEASMLDVDAPVDDVLPVGFRHPDHPNTAISTRMLLSHVSGLQDDFLALADATFNMDPTMSLAEFTSAYALESGALYSEANWGAEPGRRYSYCNAGYGVVGHILEEAGGASFDQQTTQALFEPLDLDGAGWFIRDVETARLATPYGWNGRRFNDLDQNGFAYYPASSLRISVTGLARWAQMLLRGGELDGVRVLEQTSVDEMFRLQYPALADHQALTFFYDSFGGRRYVGHSGSTFGGSTQLLLHDMLDYAIIVQTNSDAYIRSRVLMDRSGSEAIEAIIVRLGEEEATF